MLNKMILIIVMVCFVESCQTSNSFIRNDEQTQSAMITSSSDERSSITDSIKSRNFEKSVASLKEQVSQKPNDTFIRMNLAKILFLERNYEEAKDQCSAVLRINPKDIDAKKLLASIYFSTGNYEMSSIILNGLGEEKNKDSSILNLLALLALKENKSYLAINYFKESLRIDPNNVATRMNLGVLYIKYRMFKDAGIQFERVLKIMPDNTDAKMHLAVANTHIKGVNDNSYDTLKQVVKLHPDNPVALYNLAVAEMYKGQYDKAEDIVNKYLDTPYVKTYGENQAFALLGKIQNLKDSTKDLKGWSDEEINMLSRRNVKPNFKKENKNSTEESRGSIQQKKVIVSDEDKSTGTGIATEENDIIEEISDLEQQLEE